MMIEQKSIPKTPYAPTDSDSLHIDNLQDSAVKKKYIL